MLEEISNLLISEIRVANMVECKLVTDYMSSTSIVGYHSSSHLTSINATTHIVFGSTLGRPVLESLGVLGSCNHSHCIWVHPGEARAGVPGRPGVISGRVPPQRELGTGESQCVQDLVFGDGKGKVCILTAHCLGTEVDASGNGSVLNSFTLTGGSGGHRASVPLGVRAAGCVCCDVQD